MSILLKINSKSQTDSHSLHSVITNEPDSTFNESFIVSLTHAVQLKGGMVYRPVSQHKTDARFDASQWFSLSEIIVGLGSAGVFTVLYQTIAKYLERNKDSEITIERGDIKISIKGHRLPDEIDLLQRFCPEFSSLATSEVNEQIAEQTKSAESKDRDTD